MHIIFIITSFILIIAETKSIYYLKYKNNHITNLFLDDILYNMNNNQLNESFPDAYNTSLLFKECNTGVFEIKIHHRKNIHIMAIQFDGDLFIRDRKIYFRYLKLEGVFQNLWKVNKCLEDNIDEDDYEDKHCHHSGGIHNHHSGNRHNHHSGDDDCDENEDNDISITNSEPTNSYSINSNSEEVYTSIYTEYSEESTLSEDVIISEDIINYICLKHNLIDTSALCSNNGYCIGDNFNGFTCLCISGYIGEICNEYISNKCLIQNNTNKISYYNNNIDINVSLDITPTLTIIDLFGDNCTSYVNWSKQINPEDCTETYTGISSNSECYIYSCIDSNNNTIGCEINNCITSPCYKKYCSQIVITKNNIYNDSNLYIEKSEICSIKPWILNPVEVNIDAQFSMIILSIIYNTGTNLWDISILTFLSGPYKLAAVAGLSNVVEVSSCEYNSICFQNIVLHINLCSGINGVEIRIEDYLLYEWNTVGSTVNVPNISGLLSFPYLSDCIANTVEVLDDVILTFNSYSTEEYDEYSTTFYEMNSTFIFFEISGFPLIVKDIIVDNNIINNTIISTLKNATRFKLEVWDLLLISKNDSQTIRISSLFEFNNVIKVVSKEIKIIREGYNENLDKENIENQYIWPLILTIIIGVLIIIGIIIVYVLIKNKSG